MTYEGCVGCNDACKPFFEILRDGLNRALRSEKQNVASHSPHPTLALEYQSSCEPNAHAALEYGLVLVTKGLRCLIWNACRRVTNSVSVRQVLRGSDMSILAQLLLIQMAFVVGHEWTHHVHGHSDDTPGLMKHISEVDADGYSTWHVADWLLKGSGRANAISELNCLELSESGQDEVIFSAFVIAVGSLLFATVPKRDLSNVYENSHPPHAARMNWIMQNAVQWCRHNKPEVEHLMPLEKWQTLMRQTAIALWGMNGGVNWSDQVAFLRSLKGLEYARRLENGMEENRKSL